MEHATGDVDLMRTQTEGVDIEANVAKLEGLSPEGEVIDSGLASSYNDSAENDREKLGKVTDQLENEQDNQTEDAESKDPEHKSGNYVKIKEEEKSSTSISWNIGDLDHFLSVIQGPGSLVSQGQEPSELALPEHEDNKRNAERETERDSSKGKTSTKEGLPENMPAGNEWLQKEKNLEEKLDPDANISRYSEKTEETEKVSTKSHQASLEDGAQPSEGIDICPPFWWNWEQWEQCCKPCTYITKQPSYVLHRKDIKCSNTQENPETISRLYIH